MQPSNPKPSLRERAEALAADLKERHPDQFAAVIIAFAQSVAAEARADGYEQGQRDILFPAAEPEGQS